MQAVTTRRPQLAHPASVLGADDDRTSVVIVAVAAALALAIAVIHLQDQGGLLGSESPTWLRYGYYLIEVGATVSAGLIVRGKRIGWVLGVLSSLGPMVGYILSRTVGVPGDPGDVGNWGYRLGTVSLIVEGCFLVLAAIALVGLRGARPGTPDQ